MKEIIFFVAFSIISTTALSASFDCTKAGTSVEKMICSNEDISRYDDELGSLYKKAKEVFPEEKVKQRAWIEKRNQCDSIICLMSLYQQRNLELQAVVDMAPVQELAVSAVTEVSDIAELPDAYQQKDIEVQVQAPVEVVAAQEDNVSVVADSSASPESLDVNQQSYVEDQAQVQAEALENTQVMPATLKNQPNISSQIIFLSGGFLLLAMVISVWGFMKRCPSCGKWFSERVIEQELVDQQQSLKTVRREDKHRDRSGNIIKTVERQEQVQITISRYNLFHQCNKCGHEWTTTKTVESE
ncbi:lysozyme inhibitor LprI family protein [Methylobacillus sp. Pita2]|uniref:lysozyme inhibitor LprI family protein n=1 Tax=Methylobacillus sp. Pita2 TaxID=3383245 RepID=UPI0038B5019B